ncbi:MAG TPA: mechanosensitive ion channel family protein [Planctomycetes bacterium]|nr:mechanosensitive ion channel family protein [Planctomycetota bacterium]
MPPMKFHPFPAKVLVLLLPLFGWALAPGGAAQAGSPASSPGFGGGKKAAPPPAPPQAAPQKGGPVDPRFQSPLATMYTFLGAMARVRREGKEAWKDALACLDLPPNTPPEGARELAAKLLGVLNRLGEITPGTLRDKVEVEREGLRRFRFFPQALFHDWLPGKIREAGRIEFVRLPTGEWKFSRGTLLGLDRLYNAISPLPARSGSVDERRLSVPLWIRSKLPKALTSGEILSLEYWQWIGLFLVILLGVAFDRLVRFLLGLLAKRILKSGHTFVKEETLTRAVRPIGLALAALLWVELFPLVGLTGQALAVLRGAVRFFAVLAGTWALWRIVDLVAEALEWKAARTRTRVDDVLIPLLRKTVKIFIVVIGVIYAAEALNIEIAPLLASLGIGGLAFAFAAKDTIENFFGSVAVLLDRPFHVGDWVVIGNVEGIVEEVGFRSTRIRTFYNSQVTLPNASLVRATVDNYGRRKYRRWKCHIGVQYDTPPEKILAFREGIQELVRSHPYTRKDYYQVWLHQFSPSSLDILLYVFFEVPDWSTELRERERLFLDILRLARTLGIEFAFPTQTIHLYQEEKKEEEFDPLRLEERRARAKGIRGARKLVKGQPWFEKKEKPAPVAYPEGPVALDDLDEEDIPPEERRET